MQGAVYDFWLQLVFTSVPFEKIVVGYFHLEYSHCPVNYILTSDFAGQDAC